MNFLSGLILFALIAIGFFTLLPLLGFGLALFIWFLPILIIGTSNKTTGGEKIAWILAIVFFSWFAWVFYFFLAPIKPKDRYSFR